MRRRRRDESGSVSAELACLAVVFVLLALVFAALARFAQVRADLDQAVRDAARAASLRSDPDMAVADATAALDQALANQGLGCEARQVDVDTAQFRPGGSVAVAVSCRMSLADLALVALPGTKVATARFVAPIDPLIAP